MQNPTSDPFSLSSNTDSAGNRPIKLMPLGDSITDGYFCFILTHLVTNMIPHICDKGYICGSKSSGQSKMGEISITNGIALAMRNLCLKILVMVRSLRYAEEYLKSTDI